MPWLHHNRFTKTCSTVEASFGEINLNFPPRGCEMFLQKFEIYLQALSIPRFYIRVKLFKQEYRYLYSAIIIWAGY